MPIHLLLAQFPGLTKAYDVVALGLTKAYRAENKHRRILNLCAKSLTPLQQKRLGLFVKYQLPKVALFPAVLAFAGYHLAYMFGNCVPLAHNYRLKTSHESRESRHLEYLENNEQYLPALLHGYKSLSPS